MECDTQLHLWRESSARAGADIALKFALSFYEGIDLALLTRMRTESKWCEDPEWIARRQAYANKLIQYSFCHAWNKGSSYLDTADEEIVSGAEEEGSESEGSELGDEAEDPEGNEVDPENKAEASSPPPHSGAPHSGEQSRSRS